VTVDLDNRGRWWAFDSRGNSIAGPFQTNEAAWHWVDQRSDQELAEQDRYNRIRMAVNGSYEPDRY
jgi:hypothetical protein